MQITFYCPDRHIAYDGASADRTGVGGGITVRIRMAEALARRGPPGLADLQLPAPGRPSGGVVCAARERKRIGCDVLVMHSSGGAASILRRCSICRWKRGRGCLY